MATFLPAPRIRTKLSRTTVPVIPPPAMSCPQRLPAVAVAARLLSLLAVATALSSLTATKNVMMARRTVLPVRYVQAPVLFPRVARMGNVLPAQSVISKKTNVIPDVILMPTARIRSSATLLSIFAENPPIRSAYRQTNVRSMMIVRFAYPRAVPTRAVRPPQQRIARQKVF